MSLSTASANREARQARGVARYSSVRFLRGDDGWFLQGPSMLLQIGPVTATKKNGLTKTVTVRRLSEPFTRHGIEFVRGFLRD